MAILVRFPVTDLSGLKYLALAKRPPVACGKFPRIALQSIQMVGSCHPQCVVTLPILASDFGCGRQLGDYCYISFNPGL